MSTTMQPNAWNFHDGVSNAMMQPNAWNYLGGGSRVVLGDVHGVLGGVRQNES